MRVCACLFEVPFFLFPFFAREIHEECRTYLSCFGTMTQNTLALRYGATSFCLGIIAIWCRYWVPVSWIPQLGLE